MEAAPNWNREAAEQPADPLARLNERISSFENALARSAERGAPADISETTAAKVRTLAGTAAGIVRTGMLALTLAGIHETKNHFSSRYEITTVSHEDGSVEYRHPDQETNDIMDFLTGKKELAQKYRVYFYQEAVREEYSKWQGMQNKDFDIDEMNAFEKTLSADEGELRAQMIELVRQERTLIDGPDDSDANRKMIEGIADLNLMATTTVMMKYRPEIAQMAWKLQMKVGSPRIRWAAPGQNLRAGIEGRLAGPGRAFYDQGSNTVYITPGATPETLIAEDAHAYQFDRHPIATRARFVMDTARSSIEAFREGKPLWETQYRQYKRPGTMEYEAHSVIEKQLVAEAIAETEAKNGKKHTEEPRTAKSS